jgi:hypothetical protein
MSCSCGIGQAPDWLTQLIAAIQGEAIAPRDAPIKSMWDLLRQRGLLHRSRWLGNLLQRIWRQGLAARPRPRTTQRLQQLLQQWGVLPASAVTPIVVSPIVPQTVVVSPGVTRPFRPVVVRPLRPVAVRPLRPVLARVAGRRGAR